MLTKSEFEKFLYDKLIMVLEKAGKKISINQRKAMIQKMKTNSKINKNQFSY